MPGGTTATWVNAGEFTSPTGRSSVFSVMTPGSRTTRSVTVRVSGVVLAMSTTSRRLETLALLQTHPGISAPTLAARLGVTERTARRDIAQLRELGYRIDAEAGRTGGYRLAHGRTMPPLLLDADEVAAVALSLRTAVHGTGLETAAITALAKLTQIVPARWNARLAALADVQV